MGLALADTGYTNAGSSGNHVRKYIVYTLLCKHCRTTKFDDIGFTYTHSKQDPIYVFPEMKLRPILSLHFLLERCPSVRYSIARIFLIFTP